jgi:RsiW-degrading membrane proteinase PrsW (M82 family)
VLFCGALMVSLYQALFPRPARWGLVLVALVLGGGLTVVLTFLLTPTAARLGEITDLWSALRVVVLTVGLPEEGVKFVAAMTALVLFSRAATPAEAFQAALFAAIGFAIVENMLYARAFAEASLLIAFGRGIIASFVHSLMAMIQGIFLARFVRTGWRRWHLPVIGYLCAAAAHAGFDWGMLKPLAEYFASKTIQPQTMLAAAPVLLIGLPAPFLIGLWCFRRALRQAGADDPRSLDPDYQRRIDRWHRIGNTLLILGGIGLVVVVGIAAYLSKTGAIPVTTAAPSDLSAADLQGSLILTGAVVVAPVAMILGWLLRQKR